MTATLDKGVNALREVIDAPTAAFFSACVHCGICAEACLFYTETGDPKYAPIRKLEPLRRVWQREYTFFGKLAAALGLAPPVDDALLDAWSELVYDSCTLCGRCSLACPVGNDLTYMIRKLREGMAASGHAPAGLVGAVRRTVEIGSPMGATLTTLRAQIRHIEEETGLTIPMDRRGVEHMALLSSMEVINFPEYLAALAKVFHKAEISWTLSSEAFEATNAGIQIGASDIARQILLRVVEAAEKLKVRKVISPECGHAYTALRWEGPNLIGRSYLFEVIHILELLDQLRGAGRLKTTRGFDAPVTFHDPCQIVRRGGLLEQGDDLIRAVANDYRPMDDGGKWNWCCGGGGGVSANERADELRLRAFQRKKTQLDETGVDTLVTACANCRIVLEEGLEHYGMEMKVMGLVELMAEYLDEE